MFEAMYMPPVKHPEPPPLPLQLRVYRGGYDYVIATSPLEAKRVWQETTGQTIDWPAEIAFLEVGDSDTISIKTSPHSREKKTAWEWIQLRGEGFLGSFQ